MRHLHGFPGRRRLRQEEGAVAVLVGMLLFVLIGAAALAIDLGSGYATKRSLVTDLDAAALAGARTMADELRSDRGACDGGPSAGLRAAVDGAVGQLVAANGGTTDVVDVEVDCDRRTVRVRGDKQAQTTFAPLLGVDEIRPAGYAMAKAVDSGGGPILPLTVCKDAPEIAAFLGPSAAPGLLATLPHESTAGDICGGSESNYGYWGESSASTLRAWMKTKEPTMVHVQLDPPECTAPKMAGQPGWCAGETGHKNSVLQALKERPSNASCSVDAPASDCEILTILLHSHFECEANCANNAAFQPYGFLDVLIREVRTEPGELLLELTSTRLATDASSTPTTSSYLCSADGAPSGDPGCD
jgi:hypothetical protein